MIKQLRFERFGKISALTDIKPLGNAIFIDYDNGNAIPITRINSISRILGITPQTYTYSRTRRGWHIVITCVERFSHVELIAIQAIMGSDQMREALNLSRAMVGKVNKFWKHRSNILFEYKL